MTNFYPKYISSQTPYDESLVVSVFLLAIKGSKILAIKNDRGWEIPGGHIEENESFEETLIREVEEEAGASFKDAKPFVFIESDDQDIYKDKTMLIYTTDNFELGKFTPSEDAFDREIIEIEEFLSRYTGVINFKEIIYTYLNNLVV